MVHKVTTVGRQQRLDSKSTIEASLIKVDWDPQEELLAEKIDLKGQKNEGAHYPFFYFTQSRVFLGVRQSWHWNFSSNIDPVFPLVFKHLRKR